MAQATEQYWLAQVKALELQVQELQSQLKSQMEMEMVRVEKEKVQELALKKAMEWDLG
jgi:hypothetical protein